MYRHTVVAALFGVAVASSVLGDESAIRQIPSAELRWSGEGVAEAPEFRRHVVPLFSKLGCNMRACHGSFQGQNGFRLSLFGFEPEVDRQELLETDVQSEGKGPRANLATPEESLVLSKPTSEDDHGGGQRMAAGSWQYNVLRQWIAEGAKFDPQKDSMLVRFELQPSELVFADRSKPHRVRAMAWFDDGTREDVTALTTFLSNDEGIAVIDANGMIKVERTGDTAIIAQYAGGVASTQVIVPTSDVGSPFPPFPPHNKIDEFIAAKLRKLNVHPSPLWVVS